MIIIHTESSSISGFFFSHSDSFYRKKFRKAVVVSDNAYHDRLVDSLINFETVKYFTAEDYERQRFGASVRDYQKGSVQVQASLSFLVSFSSNVLQNISGSARRAGIKSFCFSSA